MNRAAEFAVRKLRLVLVICGLAVAYALLRYVWFKGVSAEQIPLYVANKALSAAGLVLIGLSAFQRSNRDRKEVGVAGFALIGAHAALSLMILEPAYFESFYLPTGRLTWQAELSMLVGTAGMVGAIWLFVATFTQRPPANAYGASLVPRLGRFVLLCGAAHVLAIGYGGWFDAGGWPGFLPPITLLSFLAAVGCIGLRIWQKQRAARLAPKAPHVVVQRSAHKDLPQKVE